MRKDLKNYNVTNKTAYKRISKYPPFKFYVPPLLLKAIMPTIKITFYHHLIEN